MRVYIYWLKNEEEHAILDSFAPLLNMLYKRPRRCHFFDYSGRPVDGGCPRSSDCFYVHPDDPQWDELPPVRAPSHRRRKPDYRVRSPELQRRSHSPPRASHRARSKSRRRSPILSRSRQRSSRSRSPPQKEPYSPVSSSAPRFKPTFHRAQTGQRISSPSSPKTDQSRAHTDSITSPVTSQTYQGTTASGMHSLPPKPQPQPASWAWTEARIPAASTLSTLQQSMPLPLMPKPPLLLSAKPSVPPPELSLEEKRKGWAERIKLLSDSIQQRSKLAQLEQDISLFKRLSHSMQSSAAPDANRDQVAQQKLALLESKHEEAKKLYETTFTELTETEKWPVPPATEGDDKELLRRVTNYCEELEQHAEDVNHLLSRSISIVPANDTHETDRSRPLKRRRVDEVGPDDQRETQFQSIDSNSETVKELRDRVLEFQGAISAIQNDQMTIRTGMMSEYKEYVDTKFKEATSEAAKNIQHVGEKVKTLRDSVNAAGSNVQALAGDIDKLALDNKAIRAGLADTNQGIRNAETEMARLEERMQRMTESFNQRTKAIEALRAAHAAHIARPVSPPNSPYLPPMDYIVQSIHDPLIDAARSALQPMLNSMRESVQALLQNRNAEMYETLWSRLALTMRLVEALSVRLAQTNSDSNNVKITSS
ncbi:hypothetical protein AX17_003469 [Amanita inopinata Kibby_2008]|nr:hypothetical protein AX17_003469 [Amanita inopinata Kibby_2008]